MVTEIPGPISEVKKGMTKEELLRNGIELISSTTEAVSGRESVLFKVRQSADEIVAIKWVLLAGDEKQSLMIMGSFRQDSEAELGDAIRRSILKASWKPRPTAR